MSEKRELPYGIVWDRDNEVMRCTLCPPAHTYPLIGPFKNLDEFFADVNIAGFLESHKHEQSMREGDGDLRNQK